MTTPVFNDAPDITSMTVPEIAFGLLLLLVIWAVLYRFVGRSSYE